MHGLRRPKLPRITRLYNKSIHDDPRASTPPSKFTIYIFQFRPCTHDCYDAIKHYAYAAAPNHHHRIRMTHRTRRKETTTFFFRSRAVSLARCRLGPVDSFIYLMCVCVCALAFFFVSCRFSNFI